ncbi:hypothetical protein MVEN_00968200 [Mycena venus]|uniref:Uncharacterized protein n=1 Tax=Mycena venus TaxID=2733690 RepID=A0A8H6Y8M0_9AGAR|nr:hypothetical protein MVEN_00968200 [Mycena venus]
MGTFLISYLLSFSLSALHLLRLFRSLVYILTHRPLWRRPFQHASVTVFARTSFATYLPPPSRRCWAYAVTITAACFPHRPPVGPRQCARCTARLADFHVAACELCRPLGGATPERTFALSRTTGCMHSTRGWRSSRSSPPPAHWTAFTSILPSPLDACLLRLLAKYRRSPLHTSPTRHRPPPTCLAHAARALAPQHLPLRSPSPTPPLSPPHAPYPSLRSKLRPATYCECHGHHPRCAPHTLQPFPRKPSATSILSFSPPRPLATPPAAHFSASHTAAQRLPIADAHRFCRADTVARADRRTSRCHQRLPSALRNSDKRGWALWAVRCPGISDRTAARSGGTLSALHTGKGTA